MVRKRVPRVLPPGEISRLVYALNEPIRTIFLLGVLLGLRIGEMLALKVGDVDLLGGWVYIRQNIYRGHIGTPKTAKSERRLPLPKVLVPWLAAQCEGKDPERWLFPNTAGTLFDDRNLIRREIEPACEKLGIRRFSWHALRHTFSTYSGNDGVAMPVLQSLLGHTTAQVTMRYTYPLEDAQREAVERVARILWPNVAGTDTRPHKRNESIN